MGQTEQGPLKAPWSWAGTQPPGPVQSCFICWWIPPWAVWNMAVRFMFSQWFKYAWDMDGPHADITTRDNSSWLENPWGQAYRECQAQYVISLALIQVQRYWLTLLIHEKSQQETAQGESWCPDTVFFQPVCCLSPRWPLWWSQCLQLRRSTVDMSSQELSSLWQKTTTSHMPKHVISRNKFHECKAYMKRPWFFSTKNVCLPRDLDSNGVLAGLHLLKPECW